MTFAMNEKHVRICDVDSDQSIPIVSEGVLGTIDINKPKSGNPNVQIIEGDPTKGYRFCLLINSSSSNNKISIYSYE